MKSKDLWKLAYGLKLYRFFFFFFTSSDYIHKDNEFYIKSTKIGEEGFFWEGVTGVSKSHSHSSYNTNISEWLVTTKCIRAKFLAIWYMVELQMGEAIVVKAARIVLKMF